MEAFECLSNYYTAYDEDGRLASRHGQVEYLTTMRYIMKYLRPSMTVLEVGAGTGRYSHALARQGCSVEAVELIPHNIEIFNRNTKAGETVAVRQGNATDLACFADGTFDITLVLGPMYHLFTQEDRVKALSEALRVTKPGGVLFAAYCVSDASIYSFGFKQGHIHELIQKGLLDTVEFKALSTPEEVFVLYRREDVEALTARLPAERLHYVATDLMTNFMRETVDAMDDETFSVYLQYHFFLCERADMTGLTHHSLDILRKY
jgi:SAM-dependent methyltransferase